MGGVLNKTIIPLTLVGFEMIIAVCTLQPHWLTVTSYPAYSLEIIIISREYASHNFKVSNGVSLIFPSSGSSNGMVLILNWHCYLILISLSLSTVGDLSRNGRNIPEV